MQRLSFIPVLLLIALAAFTSTAYAFPVFGPQARAESTSTKTSSPVASPTHPMITKLKAVFTNGGKKSPSEFSSLKHHTIGYGFTLPKYVTEKREVPLSKIKMMLEGITDKPQFQKDVFLVPTVTYAFTGWSLCMIYAAPEGFKKLKQLSLIYEKDDIDRPPPFGRPGEYIDPEKRPIVFFAANVPITGANNERTIAMHIPQIHVADAEKIGLHTHCLKSNEKPPKLWGIAEWEKYGVESWPAKLKADSDPGEPTVKSVINSSTQTSGLAGNVSPHLPEHQHNEKA
ncbi:hypothetical protein LENED_009197 [Lentinula edodes]|uniref:Uncharacterized protein n=1 Tax=Lentinula edodes TaxID=5353 RepID=A0A1Q3EJ53_LENED|nr:hypothetical protein LENED_009197 [Lentinula edodes]